MILNLIPSNPLHDRRLASWLVTHPAKDSNASPQPDLEPRSRLQPPSASACLQVCPSPPAHSSHKTSPISLSLPSSSAFLQITPLNADSRAPLDAIPSLAVEIKPPAPSPQDTQTSFTGQPTTMTSDGSGNYIKTHRASCHLTNYPNLIVYRVISHPYSHRACAMLQSVLRKFEKFN